MKDMYLSYRFISFYIHIPLSMINNFAQSFNLGAQNSPSAQIPRYDWHNQHDQHLKQQKRQWLSV